MSVSSTRLILAGLLVAKAGDELGKAHRQSDAEKVEDSIGLLETVGKYFFYGSLMYPRMIQRVLGLSGLPALKPAAVGGLRVKMLGPYPALVDGEPSAVVRGVAFDIEGAEQKEKLAQYETECYTTRQVLISVDGEEDKVLGTTFVWNGNPDDLDEGTFDVASWEKRMSRILDR